MMSLWKKIVKYAVAGLLCLGMWLLIRPWFYVFVAAPWHENSDEEGTAAMGKSLGDCGPYALTAIFSGLRNGGTIAQENALKGALRQIGEPARRALIETIEREQNPREKLGYIHILQLEFRDYRYVNFWIEFLRTRWTMPLIHLLDLDLSLGFGGNVPPVVTESHFNPDFFRWYKFESQQGRLPPLIAEQSGLSGSSAPANPALSHL